MSTPKTNRLRRAVLGLPGQDFNPLRGGVEAPELKWAGGLPIMGTSNRATPGQLGPGAQHRGPVGAAIPSIAESGSGCPGNSSNLAALSPSQRFSVPERELGRTAQSPSVNTKRGADAPFTLAPGHGNGEG